MQRLSRDTARGLQYVILQSHRSTGRGYAAIILKYDTVIIKIMDIGPAAMSDPKGFGALHPTLISARFWFALYCIFKSIMCERLDPTS